MENYKVIKALGQGTWGVVHMAEQKATGRTVAVKKIKSQETREGVNFTAIREIKLLREFKHPNIIELVDCFTTPDGAVCLVYECAITDLEKILQNKSIPISLADTKQHLHALLSAISACHERWILHRKSYKKQKCLSFDKKNFSYLISFSIHFYFILTPCPGDLKRKCVVFPSAFHTSASC